jgi:hypothetical protein
MQGVEFLDFCATPDEKYIGVATTRHQLASGGQIVLRWKIVPKKDGDGYFVASASLKTGQSESGFVESHMLDSRSEDEMVKSFVREHVNHVLNSQKPSVRNEQPQSGYSYGNGQQASYSPPVGQNQQQEEEVPF